MHIHLPKPLHGWREFVGEIAIIVVGVLIALGAEQVLENWHWRHKANETIGTIREDLSVAYAQSAEAASVAPCVDRQLVLLEDALSRPDFKPVPLYRDRAFNGFVVRTPSRPWTDSAWKSATSEGTVSHLPAALRKAFTSFYAQVGIMELNARQVDVISWRLRSLALPVTPDARARAIEAIEELRGHVEYMALVGNQLMGNADAIGMRPAAKTIDAYIERSGTIKFCEAHGLPVGRPSPEARS